MSKHKPGSKWRLLANAGPHRVELKDAGIFDELVVDDWLHIEQMSARTWWMRVGDADLNVTIDKNGKAHVTLSEGIVAKNGTITVRKAQL